MKSSKGSGKWRRGGAERKEKEDSLWPVLALAVLIK